MLFTYIHNYTYIRKFSQKAVCPNIKKMFLLMSLSFDYQINCDEV